MPDLLNTATSGLLTFQRALSTTSHNIANVNTPGYSRQSVEIVSKNASVIGESFYGNGAQIQSVSRAYDQFLTQEVRDTTSVHSRLEKFAELASHIDDVLADPQGGISPSLHELFGSIQDVSDDPASTTARIALINTAQSFTARFNNIDERFEQLANNTNSDIREVVNEINDLVVAIRNVNSALNDSHGFGGGSQESSDLLDKRDGLITELAEKVEIQVLTDPNNQMSIFIGNGQNILTGQTASSLLAKPNSANPTQDVIVYNGQITVFDISEQLKGGELGGLLDFRKNVLGEARNALGRSAIGVAEAVNAQMRKGMDLNGNLGQDLFSYTDPQVISASTNTGTATVSSVVSDISTLRTDDYSLNFDGANWTITSTSGSTATVANGAPATLVFEGVTHTINGAGAALGDSFIIKPTLFGSKSIEVVISDPNLIAAAAPIRSSASLNNLGTTAISPGIVTDETNVNLLTPVNFSFTSATSFTSNATVVVGVTSYAPGAAIPYSNNVQVEANGFRVNLSGAPQAGDVLNVQSNAGGTGDNRNVLALANLQNQSIFNGGKANFQEDYGSLVGFVGSQTNAANIERDAMGTLLKQAESRNSSLVGVNLDEEAADLVRLQQAYQAAARIITTAQNIFDTLIRSVS
jgi:flagellar hook-associated protein 1 FlgK